MAVSKKFFFGLSGLQFWSKNKGGGAGPLGPLPWIRHWCTGFVAKSRTTLYFLQQDFATYNNLTFFCKTGTTWQFNSFRRRLSKSPVIFFFLVGYPAQPHSSSLRSFLRTYERLTCSKCSFATIARFGPPFPTYLESFLASAFKFRPRFQILFSSSPEKWVEFKPEMYQHFTLGMSLLLWERRKMGLWSMTFMLLSLSRGTFFKFLHSEDPLPLNQPFCVNSVLTKRREKCIFKLISGNIYVRRCFDNKWPIEFCCFCGCFS